MKFLLLISLLAADPARDAYVRAITALQAGEFHQARVHAEDVLRLRPEFPRGLYLLAAVEAGAGRHERALALLQSIADKSLYAGVENEAAFERLRELPEADGLLRQLADNRRPRGEARTVLTLPDGHFIPEAVVHAGQDRVLIGSVRQRRVVEAHTSGDSREFIGPGSGGLMSVMGMKAVGDALWIASSGGKEAEGLPSEQQGRSGLFEFDLVTGSHRASYLLPDEGDHWLGDLLPLADGWILATDSKTGQVWRLDPRSGDWHELVPPGRLSSPQGLDHATRPGCVYLADYNGGIYLLDVSTGELQRVEVPVDINVYGIDGLYRHGNALITIQNGVQPHRIALLELDGTGTRIVAERILAAGLPEFDDPTLGQIVGDEFWFIANSHWPSFNAQGELPPAAELDGPRVMAVSLP